MMIDKDGGHRLSYAAIGRQSPICHINSSPPKLLFCSGLLNSPYEEARWGQDRPPPRQHVKINVSLWLITVLLIWKVRAVHWLVRDQSR